MRHQAGRPSRRLVQVPNLRVGSVNIPVEWSTYREDNRTIVDVRLERRFRLRTARSLAVFVDAFNVFNSNVAQAQDPITGRLETTVDGQRHEYQRFFRPLVILPPRLYRFGLNLSF